MKLPPLKDPQRYVGLFVFDFGEWASVGYTAEEVGILLASPEHAAGAAFRIYRADESGHLELTGIKPDELQAEEIIIFARSSADRAGDDFNDLRKLAQTTPPPCNIRLELVDVPETDPSHIVGLLFPRHANPQVAQWLSDAGFAGGDVVMAGEHVRRLYHQSGASPVMSTVLPAGSDRRPRTPEEVLATVREPVQR
jgi:hypothetical protein